MAILYEGGHSFEIPLEYANERESAGEFELVNWTREYGFLVYHYKVIEFDLLTLLDEF